MLVDILRHGQPEGGEVLRGRVDHPLTPEGWQQMYRNTGLDKDAPGAGPGWTHIITSPLQRCRSFAERVSTSLQLPLSVETDWQEIDYGSWDGMPVTEWRRQAEEQFRAFRQDMSALAPPGGENFVVFRDRVLAAWERIAQMPDDSHVLLVTHGGVMRVVLPTVLGMPLNRTGVLQIPFACLSRIEIAGTDQKRHAALQFHNGSL